MLSRARWAVLAVLVAVFGVTVLVAGQGGGAPVPPGTQRLGPEAGEPVVDYLRRAGASLPVEGAAPVWALVQLDRYLTPEQAAQLVHGVRLARVILRVPLPRVQTALIARDLPGQRPVAELATAFQSAARDRFAASRAVPDGRAAAVAAAEAVRLRAGCACVLALLVLGDRDELQSVVARPGVRTVQAALPGTPIQDLAVAPLLPEQADKAGPVPDDGPIPP